MRIEDDLARRTLPPPITLERGEEETVEMGPRRRRRLDRRTRIILGAAAVAATVVNAGAGWAYWRVADEGPAASSADNGVVLQLRARSDYDVPLRPGATGDLLVTVANDKPFPIHLTEIHRGTGNVVADAEHRDAGCYLPGVAVTRAVFPVNWPVEANNVQVFAVPGGLRMTPGADPTCLGGTFTVPVQAVGVRD